MEGYQILLNVAPSASKSKYPFIIMDELEVKKTRRYIELEFINALKTARREKNKKYNARGGFDKPPADCTDMVCTVVFADFS